MSKNPAHEPATVEDAQAVALVVLAAKGIDADAARRIVRHARSLQTTLPMTDPTRFRAESRAIEASARVAAALLAFIKVIDDETNKDFGRNVKVTFVRDDGEQTPMHDTTPMNE